MVTKREVAILRWISTNKFPQWGIEDHCKGCPINAYLPVLEIEGVPEYELDTDQVIWVCVPEGQYPHVKQLKGQDYMANDILPVVHNGDFQEGWAFIWKL